MIAVFSLSADVIVMECNKPRLLMEYGLSSVSLTGFKMSLILIVEVTGAGPLLAVNALGLLFCTLPAHSLTIHSYCDILETEG